MSELEHKISEDSETMTDTASEDKTDQNEIETEESAESEVNRVQEEFKKESEEEILIKTDDTEIETAQDCGRTEEIINETLEIPEEHEKYEEISETEKNNAEEHTEARNDSDSIEQTVLPLDTGRGAAILEGLLFIVGDDGLSAEQAAAALDIDSERTEDLFSALQKKYADDQYGIEIANYGGTYRFLSKAFVHDYAKKLFQISKEATLSQAALETLAIIAYKQPITRVEIEEIRGVGADMMLRKLLARALIRESGRSEAPGRPILYEVTPEFMDSFKLLSLDELPDLPKFGEEDSEESDDLFK